MGVGGCGVGVGDGVGGGLGAGGGVGAGGCGAGGVVYCALPDDHTLPATAIAPTRSAPSFGAIVTATVPLPRPVGVETIIQATSETALQNRRRAFELGSVMVHRSHDRVVRMAHVETTRRCLLCQLDTALIDKNSAGARREIGIGVDAKRNAASALPLRR